MIKKGAERSQDCKPFRTRRAVRAAAARRTLLEMHFNLEHDVIRNAALVRARPQLGYYGSSSESSSPAETTMCAVLALRIRFVS